MLVCIVVCVTQMYERSELRGPVLIEGLPGIGFVANITALHLIQELKAKLFAEIRSSSFQDFAITKENGIARFPINELYYHKRENKKSDLIVLYGNTQALTTFGQYELCGKILDIVEEHGCRYIITLGGIRREEEIKAPKIYCTASDTETLYEALSFGVEKIEGQIFGVAGLLIGLGKLRDINGFCLLAETPGTYPDAKASEKVLDVVCRMLNLKIDLSRINLAAETTSNKLKAFGLITDPTKEKIREESRLRWLI